MNSGTPDSLLVRLPSHLGDLLMAEPLLRALERENNRRVTLLGPARNFELFEGRFARMQRVALAERGDEQPALYRGHEQALLLNGAWRSAWCAFAAGVPTRVGLASNLRGPWLTNAVTPARERRGWRTRVLPRPFSDVCIELGLAAGIVVRERAPKLELGAEMLRAGAARLAALRLDPNAPFVLVHAGARPGSAKGFVLEHLVEVLRAFRTQSDLPILLACAPGEEEPARLAQSRLAAPGVFLLDVPAVGLAELCFLSARAACVLATDGGARHVARAFRTPCVVLYGPTDPRHTAEHGPEERGFAIEVPCGPCHRERCPLDGSEHKRCLSGIPTAPVVDALQTALRERRAAER